MGSASLSRQLPGDRGRRFKRGSASVLEQDTNVVTHADARMSITISRADTDRTIGRPRPPTPVAVRDAAEGVPTIRHPSQVQVHGRGLLIVDELSVAWGTIPVDPGKVIWAVLHQRH